jgi:hypothetical protein
MGSLHAQEMANAPELTMEQSLAWHLQSNHYPPVPTVMVQPCMEAIDAFWEDDLDKLISLPEGISFRGNPEAPARDIIIQHHLDAWCDDSEDDYDYLD